MQLSEFSFIGKSWELKNLEFGDASLVVGKNATGKTRTLKQLANFFRIIRQAIQFLPEGRFMAKFTQNQIVDYVYEIDITVDKYNTLFITEELKINGKVVLSRKPGSEASILNEVTEVFETINPPNNKLAIHVTRDTKKYPFFEEIAKWSEHSYIFEFSSILPGLANRNMESDLRIINDISTLYTALEESDKKTVIEDLTTIGYFLDQVKTIPGIPVDLLQIKEKGISDLIQEEDISQGMLRSIYVVIYLNYIINNAQAKTILIDDLCEGLDYERATKLGKLVFDRCKENNVQLIATSNDMFLMDVVDIKYWNVLQRKDNIVSSVNVKNHPKLFENFKYTGLSNFDFFASDYISQKLKE